MNPLYARYGHHPSAAAIAVYRDANIRAGLGPRVTPDGHRMVESKADLRDVLRASGLPKAAAERVARAGWPAIAPDEARTERLCAATEMIRQMRL